jgi:hypothetical protein
MQRVSMAVRTVGGAHDPSSIPKCLNGDVVDQRPTYPAIEVTPQARAVDVLRAAKRAHPSRPGAPSSACKPESAAEVSRLSRQHANRPIAASLSPLNHTWVVVSRRPTHGGQTNDGGGTEGRSACARHLA